MQLVAKNAIDEKVYIMLKKLAILAVIVAVPTTAMAGELKLREAHSADLGGVSVVTYYTEAATGYRVVVTAAPEASAQPIRYTATLVPGQRSVITIPQRANEAPLALVIARVGDRVVVETESSATN